MKMLLKIVLPLLILGAGIAGFLALKASRPEPQAIDAPEKQWSVRANPVVFGSYQSLAHLYGRVESPSRSELSAAIAAEVNVVKVREGQTVSKGQLLLELDRRDLLLVLNQRQAELKELEAGMLIEIIKHKADLEAFEDEQALLDLARRNLARAQKLARTKAGSEVGVDDALQAIRSRSLTLSQRRRMIENHDPSVAQLKANISRAQALKERVEYDIERTMVRAPFDGRVTNVKVSRGERVRVGDPMVELFDTGKLEVRAQIPEKFLTAIRSGLQRNDDIKGILKLEDVSYSMALDRLAGSIRQGQGGLDGFFRFSSADAPMLEVGRVATLQLSLPAVDEIVSLPVASLYGSHTVYRIVEGRLRGAEVEYIGEHLFNGTDNHVLLKSDVLRSGDMVVTSQIPAAVDGLKVQVSTR